MAVTERFTPESECDRFIKIQNVRGEPLGDMDKAAADRVGGYTLAEFREVWKEINGEYGPKQVVDVVRFEDMGAATTRGA